MRNIVNVTTGLLANNKHSNYKCSRVPLYLGEPLDFKRRVLLRLAAKGHLFALRDFDMFAGYYMYDFAWFLVNRIDGIDQHTVDHIDSVGLSLNAALVIVRRIVNRCVVNRQTVIRQPRDPLVVHLRLRFDVQVLVVLQPCDRVVL